MSTHRIGAHTICARKGKPFPVVTAYDALFAGIAEEAGIDCLLVGDSLGMVVHGHESTIPVELRDMEMHTASVARGTRTAHIIADMPFGSYEISDAAAVESAIRLVRAGAVSIKLEGGAARADRIAAITDAGIPVVGHIGVMPQTASLSGGFRRRGDRETLLADAQAVASAGAFAIVLEMVDKEITAEITAMLSIPVIGIGSGPECDAQVLVMHDLLGLYATPPPFARKFADLRGESLRAFGEYAQAVRNRSSTG